VVDLKTHGGNMDEEHDIRIVEEDHGPSCNCNWCWWARGQRLADEFGIPIEDEGDLVEYDIGGEG
jgi:hypothetical protein